MRGGAQLSVTDLRRSNRHAVNIPVIAEHRARGDILLQLSNVSTTGFMAQGIDGLGRGDRVTIRLPHVGRIEAFLVWSDGDRAGFQFERIVRLDDFTKLIKALQPTVKPR